MLPDAVIFLGRHRTRANGDQAAGRRIEAGQG